LCRKWFGRLCSTSARDFLQKTQVWVPGWHL